MSLSIDISFFSIPYENQFTLNEISHCRLQLTIDKSKQCNYNSSMKKTSNRIFIMHNVQKTDTPNVQIGMYYRHTKSESPRLFSHAFIFTSQLWYRTTVNIIPNWCLNTSKESSCSDHSYLNKFKFIYNNVQLRTQYDISYK